MRDVTEFTLTFDIVRESQHNHREFYDSSHNFTYPDGMYLLRILKEKFGDDFSFEKNYIRPNRYQSVSSVVYRFTPDEIIAGDSQIAALFEHTFEHKVKVLKGFIPHFAELQIVEQGPTYKQYDHDIHLNFEIVKDLLLESWIHNGCPENWTSMKKVKKFKPHNLPKAENHSIIDRIKHWWNQDVG